MVLRDTFPFISSVEDRERYFEEERKNRSKFDDRGWGWGRVYKLSGLYLRNMDKKRQRGSKGFPFILKLLKL